MTWISDTGSAISLGRRTPDPASNSRASSGLARVERGRRVPVPARNELFSPEWHRVGLAPDRHPRTARCHRRRAHRPRPEAEPPWRSSPPRRPGRTGSGRREYRANPAAGLAPAGRSTLLRHAERSGAPGEGRGGGTRRRAALPPTPARGRDTVRRSARLGQRPARLSRQPFDHPQVTAGRHVGHRATFFPIGDGLAFEAVAEGDIVEGQAEWAAKAADIHRRTKVRGRHDATGSQSITETCRVVEHPKLDRSSTVLQHRFQRALGLRHRDATAAQRQRRGDRLDGRQVRGGPQKNGAG